ncbi:accessory gene regulator B family protein [Romboutsia lituseburensis]|uniref:accessory gene regulator B family protein n=1 Tax=Romboutsia lituseburensis TaxID=1537 RepID=UPI00215A5FEA|nr:accessory gene regulator B family protein [Romboutsia lituseburensis]MCR8744570.1 accessory gene regulator B family protein [Romboutsia lituseburensis]
MIRNKIKNFTEDICEYNGYSKQQQEEIEYTLRIFIFEILKILIIVGLFSVIGYFKEIVFIIITMSLTKPFTGGYHESSQLKCLIATMIIFLIIIILAKNNNLNLISIILINLINIFSVYHQAPIINNDMPLTRYDLIKKNKMLALVNSSILFSIALILYSKGIYSSIITWTLFINSCLMFNKK